LTGIHAVAIKNEEKNIKDNDAKLPNIQVIRENIFKTYKVGSWRPVSFMSFAPLTPRLRYRRSVTKW
jgi:hypothetical protein